MRRILSFFLLFLPLIGLSACWRMPSQPSIVERFLFVPVTETLYVIISPAPPTGTLIRYELLSADKKCMVGGERIWSDLLEFYFPEEWHPYYLSLTLIMPSGEKSEKYLQVVRSHIIAVTRPDSLSGD